MNNINKNSAAELFGELLNIMKTLREENGCPWDRKQNHSTLRPYLIEEAYELIEAIDKSDDKAIAEELGDVLFQVVFHTRVAEDEGRFRMEDVLSIIIEKLKRRHPHVYGDVEVNSADEVIKNWEEIKRKEKREKKGNSVLDGFPKNLPALLKAKRIQEKVSRVGFDWNCVDGAMEKVDEELHEFKQAVSSQDVEHMEEELGDILFAVANVARFIEHCPEDALRKTINKFERRFRYLEEELKKRKIRLEDASIEEMDRLWEEYKSKVNKG